MKRNRLQLIGLGEVLKKEIQEIVDNERDLFFEDLTCENGRSREDYENLGIKIPKDLIEKEKAFDKEEDFDDDDYEFVEYPCTIFEDEIVGFVENEKQTTIYLRNGLAFKVKNSVFEINEKINAF